ncbi:MAG TPA: CRTAC1 family protein [Gemmataceae bacterium]|nr:CRTAC1 family protein [Gemmataceae bacterium]
MSDIFKQIIAALMLAGLLGSVVAVRYSQKSRTENTLDKSVALKRYEFFFQESAHEAGIDFTHQAPTLDKKLEDIMPIINSMGASVSIVDFDRDGLLDIYVVNSGEGSKNRLYKNLGNGKFRDVAEELGVADLNQHGTGVCMGAVWGDYDNDGYEDLLVYKWGKPELFHNDKGKGFTRVDNAGLPPWVNANSAIWLDYDRDGHLDIFIAGYWDEKLDLWHLKDTNIMPESFEYAKNGGRKYLLRNRGDGTFEDVTEKVGINSRRWTLAVAAADLCGSGYPDLFLANDYGVSEVFANRGGKEFVEIGKNCDIGTHPKSGMNVSFGDVFNRGQFSVYVSNISEPRNLVQGNNLWVPKPGTSGEGLQFVNQASSLGVEQGGWSWGGQFADFSNHGMLDLYLTNGYISANKEDNYWFEYSLIAGANKIFIADAKNWPKMRGRSLSGYQTKCLWWNKGGKFVDICKAVGVNDTFDGRAVAVADLENLGKLDLLVANQKGPLLLYRNTVAKENQWIQFELEGTKSNRSAIGARITLHWKNEARPEGQLQIQEVSGGNGYASQNMRRLHFGLGKNAQVEKAVINWPSGREQTIAAPEVNKLHKILEPSE